MTALRQEVMERVNAMPEIGLLALLQYLQEYQENNTSKEENNLSEGQENDLFLEALKDDRFVIKTDINVDDYMKELRENDRI